jgi:hypothetical protein
MDQPMKITNTEKRIAQLHATVFENVFNVANENATSSRRTDLSYEQRSTLRVMAVFAMIIACEYRHVANREGMDE